MVARNDGGSKFAAKVADRIVDDIIDWPIGSASLPSLELGDFLDESGSTSIRPSSSVWSPRSSTSSTAEVPLRR